MVSPQRRREIIDALRRGTVPQRGLDTFAVGMERFQEAIDQELEGARTGEGSSRRSVESTGAARPSSRGGSRNAPNACRSLRRRFRSPRLRHRCIGWKRCTGG